MPLDLVGLGSAIIDFAPAKTGVPLSEVTHFIPYAGGSVSNILVAASKLGLKTGFLGCVGKDEFGTLILKDFEMEGVDISCVKRVEGVATGIAFYNVDEKGERHYIFYRFPGYSDPETKLTPDDIEEEYLAQTKIFHFSEAMLRNGQTRKTVFRILDIAKENGVVVSYDPNVREALWKDKEEFQSVQKRILGFTDIFLSTLKEATLIVDGETIKETIDNIRSLGPSVIVIRERKEYYITDQDQRLAIPIFEVKAVDTSGAGDVFVAGFLCGISKKWPVNRAVMLGSAAAALKVMHVGTRKGLPTLDEAVSFLRERTKINS